eukprot:TRINITY_DN9475_c1_g1_i2.p1 TRINITY_DN9475_c1_g1~~TRINITY_DN9475_c1_g1_i2.p1  ORF type:complete len:387 (+),score=136.27 TRINITY_DN9475_c1_g1_i2:80-1240(+)
MGKVSTVFRAVTLISVAIAAACLILYSAIHHIAGLQHVTCFGGTFGLFGHATIASKPFIEYQFQRDVAYVFGMDVKLAERETQYQHIEVYAHRYFGHVLVIDGSLQISEKDEVNYHEMTAHVPMAYIPDAKKVLVIGGGDGGALLRLLEHTGVEQAHLVDIDMYAMRDVVSSYFPYLYQAYTNPRSKSFAYDGRLWVDEQLETEANHGSYQVVVLDSTDYGAAESLFTDEFYRQLKRLMGPKSILVANVDSPSWNLETVVAVQNQMTRLFNHVHIFQSHQPTFLSGHYSYVFCSDSVHPMKSPIDWSQWYAKNITTYYYNPDVHYASFILPESIRESLTQGSQLRDIPLKDGGAFASVEFKQSGPAFVLAEDEGGEADDGTAREDD